MVVTVDTAGLDRKLEAMQDALTRKGMRVLQREAENMLRKEHARAFRGGVDPGTGRGLASRKGTRGKRPGHRMLRDSGGLRKSIGESSQLYGRKGQRMLLRAEVSDSRSGNRSYHAIAGAIFFGRRDQRKRMIGRGKSKGKGGPMPPRRFSGMSKSSRRRLASRAAELLGKG